MEREDRVSVQAYRCLYANAVELDGVTVLRSVHAPGTPMLNQIVGLGVDTPATEQILDAALEAIGPEVSCYVAVAPTARPAHLADWLAERGLEPGWGWMSFRRGLGDVPEAATSLTVHPVGRDEAEAFGRIVATGYGLPDAAAPWAAGAQERGWDCWLALDGDIPAAAAGLYVDEGVGYIGFAATLPEHRGKGGQSALLAERIRHARDPRLRRSRHRDGRAARGAAVELVPQHPARRIHRGRREGELAAAVARHANPVTSHRRRAKRAPMSTRRVTMSTVSAAQTPRTPQPAHIVRARAATKTANAATIETPGRGRRSRRSGCRRARTPRRSAAASTRRAARAARTARAPPDRR